MSHCEFLEICKFFYNKMTKLPVAADSMKKIYCKQNHAKCALYKVATALGFSEVPSDLYPGDTLRAEILIQQRKK